MGKDVLRTWQSFGGAGAKKPPLKGEVPAKRAEGFRPLRRMAAAGEGCTLRVEPFKGRSHHPKSLP